MSSFGNINISEHFFEDDAAKDGPDVFNSQPTPTPSPNMVKSEVSVRKLSS
eukprot:CAMPEP_0197528434 /NCGR_PEP_ID=MMETSP1318-20131121/25095_1 /TAXON_ID=552666 /ORGANISM="Partenskyella glossopodia, Strain RCC365" /LENGTH=50 /DNA_ID=CAMNT_0043083539 /DNA_START=410 /DNA_END=558 /DNA_ORIENTATION=+